MTSPQGSGPGRIRRDVIVFGHVQGVYFRDSTRKQAERLGVDGWVRNRSDGTVEAALEGEATAVEAMLDFCRRGPERAVVQRIEVNAGVAPESLRGFTIR